MSAPLELAVHLNQAGFLGCQRLALNPITIAVTAAAAATAIYRTRVQELTNTFATAKLPDYNADAFKRLTEAVDVWTKLGDAVKEALNKFNSPGAASDRRIEQLKQTVQLKKDELAADKALEIAALERDKDQMAGLDYANKRVEIEDRYGKAGLKMDTELEQRLLSEQANKAMALGISGRNKAEAAAGIGIATSEEDSLMEEELRARAEASKAAIAERRKRISDIEAFQAGELSPAEQFALAAKRVKRGETFMTGGESIQNEQQQIAAEQISVDRYAAFMKRRQERERERERKARLESEATAEIGESAAIEAGIPEGDKLRRERDAARERIERKRIEAEALKGEEEARQLDEQRERKRKSEGKDAGGKALEDNRESFLRSTGSISPDLSGVTVDTQPVADEMAKLVATISSIVAGANQAIADTRSQSRDSMLG